MKKLFLLFIMISLLVIIISGCENAISQVDDGDTGQAEGELVDIENSP
jgi:uncharacterized protein YceK